MQKLGSERVGTTAVSGGREGLLVALLALAAGLVFLDRLGIAFVFPQLRRELGLSNAQLGGLMSATALAWAVSSVVFSFLSDRVGGRPKLIIVGCIAAFSLVTGAIGLVATFAGLILARALMGLFEGPVVPMIQSTIAATSPPQRVGRNLGLVIAGTSLFGNALPPVIITGLAASVGWRGAFLLLVVPGLVLAAALFLVMPADPQGGRRREDRDLPTLRDAVGLLHRRNVLLGAAGAALLIGFAIAFSAFLPLFLNDRSGLGAGARMIALTAFGVAGAVGAVLAPWLSDRLPRKRCLLVATACLAIAPATVALVPTHGGLLLLSIAFFLVGSGALTLMVYVIPGASVPPHLTATTFALLIALGEIVGGTAGPAIAGIVADRHGIAAAIWFSSLLAALAFVVTLGLREPDRDDAGRCAAH